MIVSKTRGRRAAFHPDHTKFLRVWGDKKTSLMDMALEFRVSVTTLRNYAHAHGMNKRPAPRGRRRGELYFPTPKEIAAAAAEIRKGWGPERFGCREDWED